jgi:predicted DCC family thiol-disulfide oxidoreductase YuxK
MMSDSKDIELIYDRQCPICDYYCQRMDVDESAGKLQRIDARENSDLMQEITDTGLDIDEGMVLKLDNRIFYGSDAIHKLAACRNVLLRILGRRRINNLSIENNDRF